MKRILHRLRLALAAASLLSTTAARAAALVASATDPTGSVAELTANATANQQPAQQPAQQPPDQQTAQPQPPGTRIQTAPRINQPTGRISIPKLDRDLSLSDFEGMQPAPALRNHLAQAPALVQNTPFDGKAPTERTDVWLGRTSTTLFAVFACYDHHPSTMRGHLARRENISADDSVGLLLDTFQDRRRGVLFQVNPAGVQADANWVENNDPDYSYDQVWNSEARRTSQGWIALMAIPFRSIRSRSTSPEWGVVLSRNLPRNSEIDFWPAISQSISGTLTQEGTLLGMEGATSHNIQINPYGLVHRIRQLDTNDPMNPYFSNRNLQGTGGGDIKAVVKDTVVLDGTINPDFSQVESDQPQFRVNQRYALFYPELRPFFLENSSYFDTPITLLYTRTVQNPEFGARATGKIQHTNIGFLAIDDRGPGIFVAPTDPLRGKRAITAVARVSQDVGKFSSVGASYAQRTLFGSANRVGGLDFNARLDQHWTLQGMMVESSTTHLDGTHTAGPATRLGLTRSGHSFFFNQRYRDFSSGYEADAGFVTVPSVRQSSTNIGYTWYPQHHFVQSYGVQSNGTVAFNRTGQRVFRYTEFDFVVTLPRNGLIVPYAGANSDSLGPRDFPTLPFRRNFTENYGGILFKAAPIPQLTLNLNVNHGATVNYNPVGNAAPTLLSEDTVKAYVTLQPIGALTIDNTYLLDRTTQANGGPGAFESQTLRTKINYQFTRALSARAIVEYDSIGRNPLVSSLNRTKQVGTQVLLTWLPHPGTAIYVGYNNDLQNLDRTLCNRTVSGMCDRNNPGVPRSSQYLNDGRDLFIKASYLLRF